MLGRMLAFYDCLDGCAVPSEHEACDSSITLRVFVRRSTRLLLCDLEEALDGESVDLDVSQKRAQEAIPTIAAKLEDMSLQRVDTRVAAVI